MNAPGKILDYEAHKEKMAQRSREKSIAARDIGEIPSIKNERRRNRATQKFRTFCEVYFPAAFSLKWSPDHLRVIAKIEKSVREGGLFAFAMPRGSGKTTLCEAAVLWSLLTGQLELASLIGPTEQHATRSLENIKTSLETNELLFEDYPEVIYPIRRRNGVGNSKPLYKGELIRMEFSSDRVILPWLAQSRAKGGIITVAGLTGAGIRGLGATRPDGVKVRPSFVMIDDPQTDESAKSVSQCADRERLLTGAVLGMAGPGKSMAGVMPCTVIRPGDLADRILDPSKHPEWNGERTKLVYRWPDSAEAVSFWKRYRELYMGGDVTAARRLYRSNRRVMDEGAVVAWPQRKLKTDISAIQHAYDLLFKHKEQAFAAEFQNEPADEKEKDRGLISRDSICEKLNGVPRGTVPAELEISTAYIDVQQDCLFWLVSSWGQHFAGGVVDYGAFPDQLRRYFTLNDLRSTLRDEFPGTGIQGALYAGLTSLVGILVGRQFPRAGGSGVARIQRILVDAQYETETIYQFCRQSPHSALLLPSHGRGIKAGNAPMATWKENAAIGEKRGHHWFRSRSDSGRGIPHVTLDTNYWKSFVHGRLAVAMGDRGSLGLFGEDPEAHRMLADHLHAETRTKTQGMGRELWEWKLRPERPDNHWLDCLAGSAAAASIQGVTMEEWASSGPRTKKMGTVPEHLRPKR